jgi:acetyl esterase
MTRFTSSFGLDPQIEKELRKMGPHFDQDVLERSRALFSDRKDHSLPEGGWKEENIAYGDHARQILDLCIPGGTKNPIVLFVPGGGFTGGDKSFYAHIPYFFARKGYLGVAMNYRLAPEFVWPAGGQDVSGALDWLAANAQRYGGNPARIFLIGQSAGAVHSATALFDRRFRPDAYDSIRAAVLMSGLYLIAVENCAPTIGVYFGDDPSVYPDRSSARFVDDSAVPVLLTLNELEPPFFAHSTAALLEALAVRDGSAPPLAWLRGHNHLSAVLGLGGPGDELGEALHAEFQKYGVKS